MRYEQAGMYKKVFSDIYGKNESQWVAMIDLDEFLYSPQQKVESYTRLAHAYDF